MLVLLVNMSGSCQLYMWNVIFEQSIFPKEIKYIPGSMAGKWIVKYKINNNLEILFDILVMILIMLYGSENNKVKWGELLLRR